MTLNTDFEDTLHELELARIADDVLHQREAPLQERVASREHLTRLRAEMAQLRLSLGITMPNVSGSHDSRTSRGTGHH